MSPSGGTAGSHGSSILVDITPRTHRVPFSTSLLGHATLSFLDSRHSNLVFDFYFGFDFDPLDDPWFWISFCVSGGHSRMFVLSTWPFTNYFSIEVSEFLICSRYKHSTEYLLFGRLPLLLTMPFIVYSSWLHILYLTSSLRIPGQTPAMIFLPLLSHTPVSLPSPPLSSALLNAYKIWNGLLNTEQLGTWQICSQPSGVGIGKNACHFFGHFIGSVFCIIINPTRFGVTQETHLWEGLGGCFQRTLTEEGKPTLSVSWRTRLRKPDEHPYSVSWQWASCNKPPAAMPSLLGYTVFPHTLSQTNLFSLSNFAQTLGQSRK